MELVTLATLIGVAVALGALAVQIVVWRTSKTDRTLQAINTSLREIAAAIYESKEP